MRLTLEGWGFATDAAFGVAVRTSGDVPACVQCVVLVFFTQLSTFKFGSLLENFSRPHSWIHCLNFEEFEIFAANFYFLQCCILYGALAIRWRPHDVPGEWELPEPWPPPDLSC